MRTFVVIGTFVVPDEVRLQVRPEHRSYLRGIDQQGGIAIAGPWVQGGGALFVYRAESLQAAERIVAGDPYTSRGVMSVESIRELQVVFPAESAPGAGGAGSAGPSQPAAPAASTEPTEPTGPAAPAAPTGPAAPAAPTEPTGPAG